MALQVVLREMGEVAVLDLVGALTEPDCSTLTIRVKELLAAGRTKIAISLEEVSRADSLGLGALTASFLSAQQQGAALKFFNPNQVVANSLHETLIDRVVQVYPTEKSALATFG